MRKHSRRVTLSIALTFLFCGVALSPPVLAQDAGANLAALKPPEGPSKWDAFADQFIESYFKLNPDFAVWAGRHEFDGQLPDLSQGGLARAAELLREWHSAALAFDPEQLSESERFDRDCVLWWTDSDLFWLTTADWPSKNPRYYDLRLDPTIYVTREYAPLEQRLRAYTAYAQANPSAAKQIRANLNSGLPRPYIDYGKMAFGGLASFYETDAPAAFASVTNPALQAEFAEANGRAIVAMKELAKWFQQLSATDQVAMGAEQLGEMLRRTELIDTPLNRLREITQADLEHNQAALKDACAAAAPAKSVAECVAVLKSHKPKDGPIEAARRQLVRLRRFLDEHDVVSIPGADEPRVTIAPPFMRWNYASMNPVGPFDKQLTTYYWIAPPDPSWSPADQDAYIPSEVDLLITSIHEIWPGHGLQFRHWNRVKSNVGQLVHSYAFTEGWAHYTEQMMLEEGFAEGDAEVHGAQLAQAIERDVRVLCAIGIHSGTMTVDQAAEMFGDTAFLDPANAQQQAARGTFDPEYMKYTLGKLMILKLRDDWCAARGGRSAWREFHDTLLSYGAAPLPLVRKAMLGPGAGPPL